MTKRYTIDAKAVEEDLERLAEYRKIMERGEKASMALMWFARNVLPETKAADVLQRVTPRILIGTTTNPSQMEAQDFIGRAADQFQDEILDRAMELAERQYRAASDMRRTTYEAVQAKIRAMRDNPPRETKT